MFRSKPPHTRPGGTRRAASGPLRAGRKTSAATDPGLGIEALRHSHQVLRAVAEPLGPGQLQQRSYARDWSIAQVLSHLGSQAEIFGLYLEAGLRGTDPPGSDAFLAIWEKRDLNGQRAQAAEALRADETAINRLGSLDPGQLRLELPGTGLDSTGLARMWLSEHAIHTWDIAVTLDSAATVAPDAAGLLIDSLGPVIANSARPGRRKQLVRVATTSPVRHFILETGDRITLVTTHGKGLPVLGLPAEAFVRLVYGRLDPGHTPPVETWRVNLDELRQIFPGF